MSKVLVVFKRCNMFDAKAFQWDWTAEVTGEEEGLLDGVERMCVCGEEWDEGEDVCSGCNDSNDGNVFNAGNDGNDGNGFRV